MNLKPIPGTLGYLASDTGRIFDEFGKERNYYKNGDGYITASVATLNGDMVTYGVHRLVAMAHVPCTYPTDVMTVNHRDGNILNNAKSNLEWVTSAMNILHASLLREDRVKPSIVVTGPAGERMLCMNLKEASEASSIESLSIWDSIKNEVEVNGWKFERLARGDKIPDDLRAKNTMARGDDGYLVKRPVSVLDTTTGNVLEFSALTAAAEYLGVSGSHVYQCITKQGRVKLLKKRYLVTYTDAEPELISKEDILRAGERGAKEVVATDSIGNKHLFESAGSFLRHTGLSKKAVTTRLKKGNIGPVGDWKFAYVGTKAEEALV